jgi:hypothetical protein
MGSGRGQAGGEFWGAHAARVLLLVTRRKIFLFELIQNNDDGCARSTSLLAKVATT